jgi:AcrR family transcriptional regulator
MGNGEMTVTGLIATANRVSPCRAASPFRNALIDLCFERGFARLTVADLCRRAGLRRVAFDEHYSDLHDCLLQISRSELADYRRRAALARAGHREWRVRLRATAYALYRYLGEDERQRHFITVELRAAGERSALLIDAEVEALFNLIDEGRAEPTAPATLTRATAESLGGAIVNQIFLVAGHDGPLPAEAELLPIIMYSAVLPYLGAASAASELQVPPPPESAVLSEP